MAFLAVRASSRVAARAFSTSRAAFNQPSIQSSAPSPSSLPSAIAGLSKVSSNGSAHVVAGDEPFQVTKAPSA